jgi:hypothetical protein
MSDQRSTPGLDRSNAERKRQADFGAWLHQRTAAWTGTPKATPDQQAADQALAPAGYTPDGARGRDPERGLDHIASSSGLGAMIEERYRRNFPESAVATDDEPAPAARPRIEREPGESAEDYRQRLVMPRLETYGASDDEEA